MVDEIDSCYSIMVILQLTLLAVIFILQGVMLVRIYVLLRRSRVALVALVIFFALSQVLSIVSALRIVAGGPKSTPEIVLYDIYNSCDQLFPAWVYITSDVAAVSFEIFLFVLALWYACRHLPSSFWRNPAAAATSLATVIVQDNLIYFFVATLSMATNAAIEIPSAATSNAFSSIAMIAQSVLVAMIGPWMVISLRRSYERNTGFTASRSHEVTTVAFATHPVVSQDGRQDKSEV